MSEPPDPLEAELSALRPRGVTPGLRRRVADRLADPPTYRRWVWGVALAGVLAAAGGLVLVAPWRRDPVVPGPPVVVPAPPAAVESEDAAPTLVAYQRALARSPEDLDALLERTAATGPNAEPDQMPVGTFPRSGATFDALLGDD